VEQPEIVVLLHGIARTPASMRPLERHLRHAGFDTHGLGYPSQHRGLADLAAFVAERLQAAGIWQRHPKVHFVTHSMGGLVVGRYLADFRAAIPEPKLGRVVMLAPPNRGSEVADFLAPLPPYRWFYGPAGLELTTLARDASGFAPHYELGIIAGTVGWPYLLGSLLIRPPHDGRVAVERTRLAGMKDHVVIPATHSFILGNAAARRQVLHFLETGRFDRS
jgi:pimeloyl-ACP methyl ester carboxylesterase